MTGLLTVEGKPKAWGRTFQALAARFEGKEIPPARTQSRPTLDWDACITSLQAENQFRSTYLQAFLADRAASVNRSDSETRSPAP